MCNTLHEACTKRQESIESTGAEAVRAVGKYAGCRQSQQVVCCLQSFGASLGEDTQVQHMWPVVQPGLHTLVWS